jgi:biotin carboxyl carrier protein
MSTSSKKEFSIVVDGQHYRVKIEELAGGELEVELDGKTHRVSMAEILGQDAPSTPPRAANQAAPISPAAIPKANQPASDKPGILSAPMPGDIVQILVKVGDQVGAGQEICVLEAMKMKNVLRASHAGTVKSIDVSLGQSVKYGETLVQFDS